MACERYEILLVDAQGQAKQQREWNSKQLLESVPWLKRMNARGHDVLIRPCEQPAPMLLDRLTPADVVKLERSGIPYLAKIEVDADEFQVWIHLGNGAVSTKVREGMTKALGLPKCDPKKFGALGGFLKHRPIATGELNRFVVVQDPIRPAPEAIAKWERMLHDAETLGMNKAPDKLRRRDRGVSR